MRILGEKELLLVSLEGLKVTNGYKLPNSPFVCVSIKDKDETMYRIHFSTIKRAKALANTRKKCVELFAVPVISTDTGHSTETMYFFNDVCIKEYEKTLNESNVEEYSREDLYDYESSTSGFDDDDEEREEEFEEEFERNVTLAGNKAKKLLHELAKFYLSAEMIDKNEYLKAKLEIEQETVTGLIFQLEVSKVAIKKLSKDIYMDRANSKLYDSLSKLQRIVLDINVTLSGIVKDSVKDMKDIKTRFNEIESEVDTAKNLVDGDVVVSSKNPRQALAYIRKQLSAGEDVEE